MINSYLFANFPKFFGDLFLFFFCSSGFKKGHYFFEKGHIWPPGHRLATPGLHVIKPNNFILYFTKLHIVYNRTYTTLTTKL